MYLFVSSLAASILSVCLALFFRGEGAKLFWRVCLPGKGLFRYSFLGKLTGLSALSVVLWGIVVTPALYSSEIARDSFEKALRQARVEDLQTNLVVTGSELRTTKGSALQTALDSNSADLYFCFGIQGGLCRQSGGEPLPQPSLDYWKNTVFASGAPFPIFPPQKVEMNGETLSIVDGGVRPQHTFGRSSKVG